MEDLLSPGDLIQYPSNNIARLAYKTPVLLWRLGLGKLIGSYVGILSHYGRNTGNVHHTPLEYFESDGQFFIVVAYGPESDWYKNILNDKRTTLQTSHGTFKLLGRRIEDKEELAEAFLAMRDKNPLMLRMYLDAIGIEYDIEDVLENDDRFLVTVFEPAGRHHCPPPVEVDMLWLWPFIIFGGLGLLLLAAQRSD